MSVNLFEVASRQKFKFSSSRGLLTVEDLWDIPLTSTTGAPNLDDVARALHSELKSDRDNISFVSEELTNNDPTIEQKLELVKHIIGVRLAERRAQSEARARAAKKQELMAIIQSKESAAIQNLDLEELYRRLNEL